MESALVIKPLQNLLDDGQAGDDFFEIGCGVGAKTIGPAKELDPDGGVDQYQAFLASVSPRI